MNLEKDKGLTINIDEISPVDFNSSSDTVGEGPMDITLVSFEPDPLSGFTATQDGSDGIEFNTGSAHDPAVFEVLFTVSPTIPLSIWNWRGVSGDDDSLFLLNVRISNST